MEFTLNGVSDQTYLGADLSMALKVGYTSGPQESVTLSVSGLPSGITPAFSSQSGTPEFYSTLTLKSTGATINSGNYVVSVTAKSTSGTERSASFKLTIPDDCAIMMNGTYDYEFEYFGTKYPQSPVQLIKVPGRQGTLKYLDPAYPKDTFLIFLDCAKSTCTTDEGGTGVFTLSPKKITITYSSGVMYFTGK